MKVTPRLNTWFSPVTNRVSIEKIPNDRSPRVIYLRQLSAGIAVLGRKCLPYQFIVFVWRRGELPIDLHVFLLVFKPSTAHFRLECLYYLACVSSFKDVPLAVAWCCWRVLMERNLQFIMLLGRKTHDKPENRLTTLYYVHLRDLHY
jgi:hypothetical protein